MKELIEFMKINKTDATQTGLLLGVTYQCINLWLKGLRTVPRPTVKLLRILNKYPELKKEL